MPSSRFPNLPGLPSVFGVPPQPASPTPFIVGSISGDPLVSPPPGAALIPIVDVTNKATTVDDVRRSTAITVTLPSHGFVAGTALFNNNGTWTKAKADAIATARVDRVVSGQGLNAGSFVAVSGGSLLGLSWAPNTQYYLSDATAGLLTTVPPTALTSFIVPVARGNTTGEATVNIGEPLSLAKIPDSALENPGGGSPGTPGTVDTGIVAMFPRTGIASGYLPLYWMECNGTNGTTDEADVGAMAVVIRHGGTVAIPVFSVPAGSYGSAQTITITCATSGVEIRVTTDGSTPSRTMGEVYTAPFIVAAGTTTVKAIAYRIPTNPTLTMIDSEIQSAVYTVTIGGDTTPPTLGSAIIPPAGTTLQLFFSEVVQVGGAGAAGVTLAMSGGAVTAVSASGAGTNTLTYTLSRTVNSGETGTVSYAQPGNGIEDGAGNDVVSFSSVAITNNSTAGGGGTAPRPFILSDGGDGSEVGASSIHEYGYKFTVGSNPMTISSLGYRRCPATYTNPTVKLFGADGLTLLASVAVPYAGVAVGETAYAAITPVVLAAGAVAHIRVLNANYNGWWVLTSAATKDPAATLNSGSYFDGTTVNSSGGVQAAHVDFKFTADVDTGGGETTALNLVAGDDFDNYPHSGILTAEANWAVMSGAVDIYKPANDAEYAASTQGHARRTDAFTSNQRSEVRLGLIGTSYSFIATSVRCQAGVNSRYQLQVDGSIYFLSVFVAGTATHISGHAGAALVLSNLDQVALEVSGAGSATRLKVQKNIAGVGWITVADNVDPGVYLDGGTPGVGGDGGSFLDARGDNWRGYDETSLGSWLYPKDIPLRPEGPLVASQNTWTYLSKVTIPAGGLTINKYSTWYRNLNATTSIKFAIMDMAFVPVAGTTVSTTTILAPGVSNVWDDFPVPTPFLLPAGDYYVMLTVTGPYDGSISLSALESVPPVGQLSFAHGFADQPGSHPAGDYSTYNNLTVRLGTA